MNIFSLYDFPQMNLKEFQYFSFQNIDSTKHSKNQDF